MNLYLGVILGFLAGITTSFLLNKFWVFENKSKKYKRQITKFLMVSISSFYLTLGLMYVFVDVFGIHYLFSKILVVGIILLGNYLVNKIWTFSDADETETRPKKTGFNLKYSIIVPVYNEEKRIVETLKDVKNYFDSKGDKYEIIVVNDGSTDGTVSVVKNFDDRIRIIENPKNMGKGFSVRNGVLSAEGEYILFIDADNSTPIDNFSKLEKYLDEYDVIIGSRYLLDSEVIKKQPWYRRLIGRFGNKLINLFLLEGIKDTQCGFKLFKHNPAVDVFSLQKINGFGFDFEILFISKIKGYHIKEVPVSWLNDRESKFNIFKDSFKTLLELFYIKVNYWLDGYK